MKLGLVTGSVVCDPLDESLRGERLLIVQPIDEDRRFVGQPVVACDTVQAGPGDTVIWEGGREAAMMLRHSFNLSDAAIVSIVDSIDREQIS